MAGGSSESSPEESDVCALLALPDISEAISPVSWVSLVRDLGGSKTHRSVRKLGTSQLHRICLPSVSETLPQKLHLELFCVVRQ